MKKIIALSILISALHFTKVHAQEKVYDVVPAKEKLPKAENLPENHIYKAIDQLPEFPGGLQKFGEFVMNNFTFPDELTQSVRFVINFVVEKDGSLTNVKLNQDPGFGINDEIKRIFALSPKWKPGYYQDKPVRTAFMFPLALQFE
ncbi:hypothetical protein GV828_10610 [Flavobacterium sp. NST-5]|uniref:TonB C-terminal domain-containing protein n=1 Tax=Flavobacterium ichthyis TaxID=2698827 RepID=A0ABW9ZEE2_9FLAO|nr:hypothetical protein [Flavobacterium ichthyis]NBL65652.1 hypothetical protein [Flavobacterium ichthyis]